MSRKNEFNELFDKISDGRGDDSDLSKFNRQMDRLFEDADQLDLKTQDLNKVKEIMWAKLLVAAKPERKGILKLQNWRMVGIAASLLLVLGIGWYTFKSADKVDVSVSIVRDREPLVSEAVLKLAGGKKLYFNSSHTDTVNDNENVKVSRNIDGTIQFDYAAGQRDGIVRYDTLETSQGGVFRIRLSDGTLISLNAASKIRFPESFAKQTPRNVELLEGEAYFDIVHNDQWKFRVQTSKGQIEDLGTKFLVSAYKGDKKVNTVVEEGSVNLRYDGKSRGLIPGQGAEISEDNKLRVYQAKVAEVTDWKDGVFRFEDSSLENIMVKIGKWYGIRIEYGNSHLKNKLFSGVISRSKKLSEVLEMLTITSDIHFRIEENRILIN